MHTDDRTKHEYKFRSFTVLVTQNTPINDTPKPEYKLCEINYPNVFGIIPRSHNITISL